MSLATAKNALKLCYCMSEIFPSEIKDSTLSAIESEVNSKMKKDGYVIIWQVQSILWARWTDGHFIPENSVSLNPVDWIEVRVFNEQEELYLQKDDIGFSGRYRADGCDVKDDEETSTPYVDSFSRFWGERDQSYLKQGWEALEDKERKLRMVIPVETQGCRWYGLTTRNYVASEAASGLSGYADYRFVDISNAEEGI